MLCVVELKIFSIAQLSWKAGTLPLGELHFQCTIGLFYYVINYTIFLGETWVYFLFDYGMFMVLLAEFNLHIFTSIYAYIIFHSSILRIVQITLDSKGSIFMFLTQAT